MLDCLVNRIGIRGCDAISTGVIYYVNDLPGVSGTMIEALVNEEQETFLGLWERIVLRTWPKFQSRLKAEINTCYRITKNSVIDCLVCHEDNDGLFDVALWYLHGVELMIERTSTDEMSRYTTIDLQQAEKLKAEFYNEFETALKDAVGSMDVVNSPCVEKCLQSNEAIRWEMQTP